MKCKRKWYSVIWICCLILSSPSVVYGDACTDLCDLTANTAREVILLNAQQEQDNITLAYQAAMFLCGQDVACQNAAGIAAQAASDALFLAVNAALAAVHVAYLACIALCTS